jgi:hypothetical protein
VKGKTRNGPSNAGDSDQAESFHGLSLHGQADAVGADHACPMVSRCFYLLLNAPDEHQKNELTRPWQKNKLADLKRIGITCQ